MYSHDEDDYSHLLQDTGSVDKSPIISPDNKSKAGRSSCAICGAKSTGINFDVMTCSSCKAFFRRNGVKPLHQFVCRASSDCKVDERSRRQCTACRLRKCFAMGMIKERIRTKEQNQRHRILVEENRRQKLRKQQQQQQQQQPQHQTPSKEITVKQERWPPESQKCSTSSSFARSSQIDAVFDLFLHSARDISSDFHFRFDHDLTTVLNHYCLPVSCFIAFTKQLSQFQQLPVDDRLVLLKNNAKVLLPLITHLLHTTCNVPFADKQTGPCEATQRLSHACSLFAKVVSDENRLMVLIMTCVLFCPCLLTRASLSDVGHISSHSHRLIQHTYDEFTQWIWHYLVHKYDSDEQQATLAHVKIVSTILRVQNLTSEIYDIAECSVKIDELHMMMQSVLHLM